MPAALSPDELELLRRIAVDIAKSAAALRDPDSYICAAVLGAAAQFAEDDDYPGDAVAVLLREVHLRRLH
jgi:hypothetical protein